MAKINPFKNKNNQKIFMITLMVILILGIALIIAYRADINIFNKIIIGISNIIHNNLFILLFYIAVLFIFREQLNLQNPTIVTFIKVSLIIVSAYFSYRAFLNLNTPYFISVVGGISFALGIQQLTAFIFAVKTKKLVYEFDKWLLITLFFCLGAAMLLDMSMTAVNLVLGEGRFVIFQESLDKRYEIEKARAIQEQSKAIQSQVAHLDSLRKEKNYGNMRHQSNIFLAQKDSNQVNLKDSETGIFLGPIQKGFTNMFNSKTIGKLLTVFFIFAISFSLTVLIVVMEIKDQYSVSKDVTKSVTKDVTAQGVTVPKNNEKVYPVTPLTPVTPQVTGNTQGNKKGNTQFGFHVTGNSNKKPSKLQKEIIEVYDAHKERDLVNEMNVSKIAKHAKRSRKFIYQTLYAFTDFKRREREN